MLSGKELVLKAFAGEQVDRIPWVPFCGVHSGSLVDMTADEFLRSADGIVAGQNEAVKRYRPDGIPVVFDLQIEAEVLGCELKWGDENPPAVISHPLDDGQITLDDLQLPEAHQGRIPIVVDATRQLRQEHPDLALYGIITGPFTLALHLLGTRIFMDMFDQPDEVHKLLDYTAAVGRRMADIYAEAGADIIAVVDPMTSQIGPDQFRQFCTSPCSNVFEHIHTIGLKGSFFVCGHAQQNIEVMCECRCDNISIDENIPLDYVRDICQPRNISFGGNLQLTVVMLIGSAEDNRRNAVECMDIGGTQGFILSPGCDIPYATPPGNIEAIAEVVHDAYQRQVVRELADKQADGELPFDMSEYGGSERVIVDVITLDSEGCAPCQYMVEAVKRVAPQFEGIVVWREHKIKYRESVAFMSSLMVHNIPTICIDGQITFVSRIPRKEELIDAIQKRINEKLKLRIESQSKIIRVFGKPTPECLQTREIVQQAIKELGANIMYQEIEDESVYARHGVIATPAVAVVTQSIKSAGKVPHPAAVKEWLKQLQV